MDIKLALGICLFLGSACGSARQKKINPETVQAGFRSIRSVDRSRLYKPETDSLNYLHYRPVDIDIWYPAAALKKDTALRFRDLLFLLEQRANYYTNSHSATGITRQIAQSLCEGFHCSDTAKLLGFKTHSFPGAAPVSGKFPLVIYLCSYNGMGYENYQLFEQLAKQGMVVMCVSSIGRYPGDMTMQYGDLMEQVNDALFSYKTIAQSDYIDPARIGIIGYSWGGLAGAIVAGKIRGVKCLLSLEGSEYHHYGSEKDENANFEAIRKSPDFQNLSISAPYLRLESSPAPHREKLDSVYDFSEKLSGEKRILAIDSAAHQDFSCLPELVNASGHCQGHTPYSRVLDSAERFLEDQLLTKTDR